MGLFTKTNNLGQALNRIDYFNDLFNQNKEEEVTQIFKFAKTLLYSVSERQFTKSLNNSRGTIDEAVLNMISNAAMFKAKDSGTVSYLSGDNAAAKVFNQVNQYKLDKKYISQKQFEENNTAFLCSVSGMPYLG